MDCKPHHLLYTELFQTHHFTYNDGIIMTSSRENGDRKFFNNSFADGGILPKFCQWVYIVRNTSVLDGPNYLCYQ